MCTWYMVPHIVLDFIGGKQQIAKVEETICTSTKVNGWLVTPSLRFDRSVFVARDGLRAGEKSS